MLTFHSFDFQFPSMGLNNIIAQTQTQASSLTCWFGSKKRLKNFILYFLRNTINVVINTYHYTIV